MGVRTYLLDENTIEFNAVSESELTSVFKAKDFITSHLFLILYKKRQNQILSKIYFQSISRRRLPNLGPNKPTITIQNGVVYLDGYSKIVKPDLMASNGVVHGIDEVLFPPGT